MKVFFVDFISQDIAKQLEIVNEIRNFIPFRVCYPILFRILVEGDVPAYIDSLYDHTILQLDFENVLKQAIESKIFILSDGPGSGKTTSFQQFTIRAKKIYPAKWVSYIDVRDIKEFLNKTVESMQDIENILENIHGLSNENKFEKSIFLEYFKMGNVILFWDHFDQVPDLTTNVAKIIYLIFNQGKNVQFLSTRKLYSDTLRSIFPSPIFTFVPLLDSFSDAFLTDYFITHGISPNETSIYSRRAAYFVWSEVFKRDCYTPFMLGMIAENVINGNYTNGTYPNIYVMLESFLIEKIQIWSESDFGKKFIKDNIMNTDFTIMKFYEKYMINFLTKIEEYDNVYFVYGLKIMRMEIPEELTSDQISRMGILYIDGPKSFELVHDAFISFFTVKYIIDNIYNANDDPTEHEAELRLRLFFHVTTNVKTVITDLIYNYINSITVLKNEEFQPTIAHVLRNKYRNILLNAYKINSNILPCYLLFFQKDHKLLLDLLHINENETILNSIFDFTNMMIISYPFYYSYRNITTGFFQLILDKNEYQIVTQKQHELKGMVQYSLYLLYNRYENYKPEDIVNFYKNFTSLDKNLLENTNVTFVFESIKKNLTQLQLRNFLYSKTVIYPLIKNSSMNNGFYYDDMREGPIEFFEYLWNLLEKTFSEKEIKTWISSRFEIFFLFKNVTYRNYFLKKAETYFTKSQLNEIFFTKDVLHLTIQYNFDSFQYAWDFFLVMQLISKYVNY